MISCYQLLFCFSFFPRNFLSEISFRNTIRVSSSLDTDQARLSVGPDLGTSFLRRLSAVDTGKELTHKTLTHKNHRLLFFNSKLYSSI